MSTPKRVIRKKHLTQKQWPLNGVTQLHEKLTALFDLLFLLQTEENAVTGQLPNKCWGAFQFSSVT
jgi:hypothetical protein